jgi:hypothetical protein
MHFDKTSKFDFSRLALSLPGRAFFNKQKSNNMDALFTFAKENFDLISLFVGIVGVVIGFISVIYELKERKKKKSKKDKK